MNIKEKQIVLYYIKNALKNGLEPEDMESVCRTAVRQSRDLLGIDIIKVFSGLKTNSEDFEKDAFVAGLITGNIENADLIKNQELNAKFQEMLNLTNLNNADVKCDITAPEFDKSLNYVFDAFDLPESCRNLVRCFIYINKVPLLRRIFRNIGDQFSSNAISEDNAEVLSCLTNVSMDDIKQALSHNGTLVEVGILRPKFGSDMDFTNMFSKLLNMHFESTNDVRNALIGKPLEATLTSANFEYMTDDYKNIRDILNSALQKQTKGINILLYGRPGCGKTEMAKTICSELGVRLYSTPENKEDKECRFSDLSQMQTILKHDDNAIVLFDEAEDVFLVNPFSKTATSKLYINRKLENNKRPVIWITNNIFFMDSAYIRRFTLAVNIKDPDDAAKFNAWKRIFQTHELDISDEYLQKLIKKYNVPLALVDTAVKNAKMMGNVDMIEYTIDNLVLAITGVKPMDKNSDEIAFDTALLNTDVDLKKLATQIKSKNVTNFSLCLYGAPGTGKTAFAKYLADELKMPMVKKRASDIMGKYLGETEKNIANAFSEAQTKKAILVFDEADSFLRDRGRADKSWEISSVNEMLTQMENAKYPFICTTNLMDSLDKASLRRFSFKVKYDYLKPEQVVRAFKDFFDVDVDLNDVAALDKLAPGDFKVVKNQSKILDINDKNDLIKMLQDEQKTKVGKQHEKIGF